MSEIAICDMCQKKLPIRRTWRDNNVYYQFRLGRRAVWLGINVYQGKPDAMGRSRRWQRGRNHLDLCKACTLQAVLAARKSFKGPQMAHILNPLPKKKTAK